jgi:hypothetical protein
VVVAEKPPKSTRQGLRDPARVAPPPSHPETTPPRPALPAGPAVTRAFTVAANPKRVDVYLDGIQQPGFDAFRGDKLNVEWRGVHKLELRNDDCCERFIAEFGPDKASKFVDLENDTIIAVLPRKLATVTIKLRPPRDDVQIEIRELAEDPKAASPPIAVKNGEPVSIRFDAKGDPRKTMQVSVYMGDKTVRQTFDVRAGGKTEVTVPLE